MDVPHRIAAGAIVFRGGAVLLVRYREADGSSYLVGPGGALEGEENAFQAVVREVREETGLPVLPRKILFVEDLLCRRFKMCKIWILAEALAGEIQATEGAVEEGIVEAGWFTRDRLVGETVYPPTLLEHEWSRFRDDGWDVLCLASRPANF
jgi:8-oxo-dGTP pyrophosphatase MutT (NUDIX family)